MGLAHSINRRSAQRLRPTIAMTDTFPCTAGFNFTVADANGDVFLVGSEAPHFAGRLIERIRRGLDRRRADG